MKSKKAEAKDLQCPALKGETGFCRFCAWTNTYADQPESAGRRCLELREAYYRVRNRVSDSEIELEDAK